MRPQPQISLTPILTGAVLGDGGISKAGTFQYACIDESTVAFLWRHTQELHIPASFGSRRMKCGYPNQKLCHWVSTGARFKEARSEWYPSGIKQIPRSLELTADVVRWWFIGDGSAQLCGPKRNSLVAHLHTEAFTREDNLTLIALFATVGLKASLCTSKGRYYYLCFSGRNSEHFFEFMGPCPPDIQSMSYKWRFFSGVTKKICVVCGKEFEPRWSHAILCSADCRAIRWKRDWYKTNN